MTKSTTRCLRMGSRPYLRALLVSFCLALVLQTVMAIAASSSAANAGGKIAGSDIEHEGWKGHALNDDSEQFSHCFIGGGLDQGVWLAFVLVDSWRWTIILRHPDWRVGNGERHAASWRIDSHSEHSFLATGKGDRLLTEAAIGGRLYEEFRQGRIATFSAAGRTFSFSLAGASGALQKLSDCVQQHSEAAHDSTPLKREPFKDIEWFDGGSAGSARQTAHVRPRERPWPKSLSLGTNELKSLLIASGAPSPSFYPALEHENLGPNVVEHRWDATRAPHVFGRSFYFPTSQFTPQAMLAVIAESSLLACDSAKTATLYDLSDVGAGAQLGRAVLGCTMSGRHMAFYVTGLFRGDESFVVSHQAREEGDATARTIDEELSHRIVDQ